MDYFNKAFLIKKLLYQSKNRGSKETGFILSKFAERFLFDMDEEALHNFAFILDQNDIDIYNWLTQKTSPPSHLNSEVMTTLLNFDIKHIEEK